MGDYWQNSKIVVNFRVHRNLHIFFAVKCIKIIAQIKSNFKGRPTSNLQIQM